MGLLDNISAAIGGHEDQVNDGIDKIGDLSSMTRPAASTPARSTRLRTS
jgi:hypothetical protein